MKTPNTLKSILTIVLSFFAIATFASAATTTLASGKWTKKEHSISGSWKIIDEDGVKKLKIYNLSTKSAPNLKIFLHPKAIASVTNSNATSSSKLVDELASPKGNQTYTLPSGIDLDDYKSVIIHCERYSKLWGGANL